MDIKEFFAGTLAGMAQVLVGQPFDIVKVRLASSTESIGAMTTAKQILANEGALAFWKGSVPPLAGVGACVSIQFGVNEAVKRAILARNNQTDLTTVQGCLAGGIAGVSNSVVSSPAEHLRIRMQVQGRVDPRGDPTYKNSIDCGKTVYKNHGVKGIYKGFVVCALREGCTFASYFGTYNYLTNLVKPEGGTTKDIAAWKLMICGGLTGFAYWGPWYPIDIVKSKLQADSLANPRYKGAIDCAQYVMKTEGVGGFYRGFIPCMLRAFPANAATFLTFEFVMRLISS